jgi:predicted nucleic acid-binding protein
MPKFTGNYFFDTVTLSNFALVGRLDLLVARYGKRAVLTPEVLDEVTDGVVAGYRALSAIESAVDDGAVGLSGPLVSAAERRTYRELLRNVAPGEASCIAHACEHGGIVVTDDHTARQCCRDRNVPTTGTIGILKAFCVDGTLAPQEADGILEAMIDAGYYSPVQRISSLI